MNYLKIDNCNMNNGDGLRCVVWLSGCNHHCKGCFNPETWDKNNGDEVTDKHIKKILDFISNDWCSGLTLTGGDPLCQGDAGLCDLCSLTADVHAIGKTVWLWTGFKWEDFKQSNIKDNTTYLQHILLTSCDVVVDGQFVQSQKNLTLKWRGSSNQRVIDVKATLASNNIILYEE